MHQHQQQHQSSAISIPTASMSRPSKSGSPSRQPETGSDATVAGAGAQGIRRNDQGQGQDSCDEAALMALLKRLGLALSPPSTPNGSRRCPGDDGVSSAGSGGCNGNNGNIGKNDPMETQQQQQQQQRRRQQDNCSNGSSQAQHQQMQQQNRNFGEGSAFGGRGASSDSPGNRPPPRRERQNSPFAHHHHHYQQQQQQQQQLHHDHAPHNHDPMVTSTNNMARVFEGGGNSTTRSSSANPRPPPPSPILNRHNLDSSASASSSSAGTIPPSPNAQTGPPSEWLHQRQPVGGNGARRGGGSGGAGGGNGSRAVTDDEASARGPVTMAAAATTDGMVDLMRCEITAKEAVLLGPILRAATGVACLKLCYNHLRDGGAEAVSSSIERHPSLHTMDLGFNGIADQGASSLARSLASNRSLKTLYLSGNSIGPTGARALAGSLAGGLATLHLSGNCIGPDGAAALAEALRSNTSLTRLYIDGAGIKARGACAVSSALVTNNVLSDLYMSDNEIGDEGLEGLAHALRRNRSVRLLELCFNRITAVGAETLSKCIWGCTTLRALHLDNNQLGDRGAQALASALPTLALETLELGFNNVAAAGVSALMQAAVASPSFMGLSLSGNVLDAEAAKAIQGALAQPRCTLRRLFIDHASLGRASESFIATGVLTNRCLALTTLTGFRLGAAFARLGMPPQVEVFSNDQALEQVRLYWANHGNTATVPSAAGVAASAAVCGGGGSVAGAGGGAGIVSVRSGMGPFQESGAGRGTGRLASLSRAAATVCGGDGASQSRSQTQRASPKGVIGGAGGGAGGGVGNGGGGGGSGDGGGGPSAFIPAPAVTTTTGAIAAGAGAGAGGSSNGVGGKNNGGLLLSGKQPGTQVVAAENLPPHYLESVGGLDRSRGGHGDGGVAYGSAARRARESPLDIPNASLWGLRRGGPGQVAVGGAAEAGLKACRVTAGDRPGVPAATGDGIDVHSTAMVRAVQPRAVRGLGDGDKGEVNSQRSPIHALLGIARLPFSAAELWSLHQHYFSPSPDHQRCLESPTTNPLGGGGSITPTIAPAPLKSPGNKIPPIILPATAGGGAGWSDAVRLSLSRHSSERTGSTGGGSRADTVKHRHNSICGDGGGGSSINGTNGGKDREGPGGGGGGENGQGAAAGEGFLTGVDGVVGEGAGAGARRSRRSSSLGGEYDDHEDDADSPRPPSKRYRNASTKTRIACFPRVQDRIRALKSKPDERGVLTLLRQLKFLQTGGGGGACNGGDGVSTTLAAPRVGGNLTHADGFPAPTADAMLSGHGRKGRTEGGAVVDGGGSGNVPTNCLADEEIERLLLEEL